MKKFVKRFLCFISVFIIVLFFGFISMIVTYKLPNDRVEKNIEKSVGNFSDGKNWDTLIDEYYGTTLDNYTDAIILSELHYNDKKHSAIEKSMRVYGKYNGNDPVESLLNIKNNKEKVTSYERYWHGNLVILKPLFMLLDYSSIRILNFVIQVLLLILIFKLMIKKGLKKYVVPLIISFLLINPIVISLSLQFSAVYYIILISIILLLYFKEKIIKYNLFPYFFLIIGMLTSFFDFFTYPIATIGVPLAFVLAFDDNDKKDKKYIFKLILKMAICCVSWIFGYAAMWFAKWAISSIILHENVIADSLNQVFFRTGVSNYTRIDVLTKNIKVYARTAYYVIFIMILVYYVVRFIKNRNELNKNNIAMLIPYGIISMMPIVWYLAISNHSYIHFWFTHRALVVLFVAGLFYLESMIKCKVEEGVKEDEKRK